MTPRPNSSYTSKSRLNIHGTREGKKKPSKAYSYVHRPNDVQSASSKYYAAPKKLTEAKKEVAKPLVTEIIEPASSKTVVAEVKKALNSIRKDGNEATVIVRCPSDDLASYRSAVELAVGAMRLTRKEADAVSFVPMNPSPLEVKEKLEEEKPKPKAKKPRAKRKKKTETAIETQPVVSADPASVPEPEIVESPAEEPVEDSAITEDDIEKLLNQGYESDD